MMYLNTIGQEGDGSPQTHKLFIVVIETQVLQMA